MEDFYRIRRLPPYVFEQINRAKAAARNSGADIIDMGMGNPDLPTPPHVLEKLKETLGKPRTDGYSSSKGIPGLRKAQAGYYARRFGVKLNPDTQIVATLGSKEGFANVAQAITAPGDVVLVPNPSYPIHAFGFLMAGGVIRSVPSDPTPEFFPAVERAIQHSIPKPIALVVCYPSNPTAKVASLDFYKDLVAFAKKHEIYILSDLAYAEVYFNDKNPPPSVLQVPGAIDVCVEFTSMSKTFSMAGWRMGFAVGNERIISALTRVKSYLDYGAFTPVQVAATAALNGPEDCIKASAKCATPTASAATCWWTASAVPAGPFRRRNRRCSPGRRCRRNSARSAPCSLQRFWLKSPASWSRPASVSASMARAMSASPWSKTSSAFARLPAASAASLKAGWKRCTTWFRSPIGDRHRTGVACGARSVAQ